MDADELQPRLTTGDSDEDRAEIGLTGERGTGEGREAHVEGETQDQPQHVTRARLGRWPVLAAA